MSLDDNKAESANFLADKIMRASIKSEIAVNDKDKAIGNTAEQRYELLSLCSHEMADTIMLLIAFTSQQNIDHKSCYLCCCIVYIW